MPQEIGYNRQVRPQAGAALPAVSAESFGAGLGRQIEQTGEMLHREGLEDYAIERRQIASEETAQFQRAFVMARENMSGISREMRKDAGPGHGAAMAENWEAHRAGLLDNITDNDVRQRAAGAFDDFGLRIRNDETGFEEVRRVERVLTDWSDTQTLTANRIRRMETPDAYLSEMEIGHAAIDGMDISESDKDKARREWDQTGAVAFLRGRIDDDPPLAKAMLQGGLFDDVLDPNQIEALLNNADTGIRSLQVAVEREAAQAQAAFRQQVRLIKEAHDQNIDIAEQLPDLIEQASAFGLPEVALELDGMLAESAFAQIYEAATPVQREQRMAALEAKDKPTAQEQRELGYLKRTQSAADSRFNSDPAGFYARNGGASAPPPLDFADPASVAARANWARAASEANGRPISPVTRNQISELRSQYQSGGRAGQIAVIDALAQFPADQAALAALQVDPGDPTLAVMVTLSNDVRSMALDGRDALKANRQLLKPANLNVERELAALDARFVQALRPVAPAQRDAVRTVASQIAAGLIDRDGKEMSPFRHWRALNAALGARMVTNSEGNQEQRGGIGRWGDNYFLLPDGVSPAAFASGVQRALRDLPNKPVNPDGSAANLQRTFPVMVSDGVYEFHTPAGNAVRGSNGAPWRIRVQPR